MCVVIFPLHQIDGHFPLHQIDGHDCWGTNQCSALNAFYPVLIYVQYKIYTVCIHIYIYHIYNIYRSFGILCWARIATSRFSNWQATLWKPMTYISLSKKNFNLKKRNIMQKKLPCFYGCSVVFVALWPMGQIMEFPAELSLALSPRRGKFPGSNHPSISPRIPCENSPRCVAD